MGLFDRMKESAKAQQEKKDNTPKSVTVMFEQLPESLSDMQKLPESALSTPFMTAALAVCAYCCYAVDKEAGKEMLNFLKGPKPLSN